MTLISWTPPKTIAKKPLRLIVETGQDPEIKNSNRARIIQIEAARCPSASTA